MNSAKEIVFEKYEDACVVADKLMSNGYVVMMSREELFYVISYIWVDDYANRNKVIFAPTDGTFCQRKECGIETCFDCPRYADDCDGDDEVSDDK